MVLRVRQSGESNREAFFLTAESGLIRATVFGGAKSRLRSFVSPFHEGTLWAYHDTVKDFLKVTDFDVRQWRPGLRERYGRAMAAAAVSETVSVSHAGGGNWAAALNVASQTLDALDAAEDNMVARIFCQFLWNWNDLIGEKPPLGECSLCGLAFPPGESALYAPVEGALLCPECAVGHTGVSLSAGARKWLAAAERVPPAEIGRWTLDAPSLHEVRTLAVLVMAGQLGRRLESWDWHA